LRFRAGADSNHRDNRPDTDDNSQRGQYGAHFVSP
jgi:hypothetical protein